MPCVKCDLNFQRIQEVNGIGNISADIVFLLDFPRRNETRKGISFIHSMYDKWFNELDKLGFNVTNAYFTYLIKCPMDVKFIHYHKEHELNTRVCTSNNLEIPNMLNLKMIVCVGFFVTEYILSNSQYEKYTWRQYMNNTLKIDKYLYHFIHHPSQLDRNIDNLRRDYKCFVNPFHTHKL